jgi:hypothetical protein
MLYRAMFLKQSNIFSPQQYLGLHVIYPDLSLDIYDNMAYILGSLNIFALTLCTVLLFMGRNRPQTSEVLPRYTDYIQKSHFHLHILYIQHVWMC